MRTVQSAARVTENPWPCSCDCLCSHSPLNSDGSHAQLLTHSMPAHARSLLRVHDALFGHTHAGYSRKHAVSFEHWITMPA